MHLPSLSAGKLLSSRCSWPLEQVSGWVISSLFTEKPHCDIKMLFLLGAQVIFKGNSKCSDHKSALISYKIKQVGNVCGFFLIKFIIMLMYILLRTDCRVLIKINHGLVMIVETVELKNSPFCDGDFPFLSFRKVKNNLHRSRSLSRG